MKRYKRKIPIISPLIIAAAVLSTAVASGVSVLLGDHALGIVFGGVSVALFVLFLSDLLATAGRYCYYDNDVELSCVPLIKKKLPYSRYNAVVISNASYNYSYGSYSIPMQYKTAGSAKCAKVTLPYITLLGAQYPLNKVTSGMDNRELYVLHDDRYCLGICWFDSLRHLMKKRNYPVYVLEDVYLRFREQFDRVFLEADDISDRAYIITTHCVPYRIYLDGIKKT